MKAFYLLYYNSFASKGQRNLFRGAVYSLPWVKTNAKHIHKKRFVPRRESEENRVGKVQATSLAYTSYSFEYQ